MVAGVLIIVFSVVLFAYWFRYTCLLLLRNQTSEDHAPQMAEANRLNFPAVRAALEAGAPKASLDPLRSALESDYRILDYLLKHAAEFGGSSVDQWLLRMDFRLMNFWYRVSGRSAALVEMAGVVAYLADAMGKRIAYQTDS